MFSARTDWNLAENRLSRALAELRAAGKPFLDLTRSNPTECGFIYDDRGIECALAQPGIRLYQPDPRGISTARQVISAYYEGRQTHVKTARPGVSPRSHRQP